MNAMKFVVILLIGVVCANVGARKLEGESKETNVRISISETASTKGLGAQLSSVDSNNYGSGSGYSSSSATSGPDGPSSDTYASGSGYSGISSSVNGPTASSDTGSSGYGVGSTNAAANPSGASSDGYGYGGGSSYGFGNAGP